MAQTGRRFVARTREGDAETIDWLLSGNRIGKRVQLECDGQKYKSRKNGKGEGFSTCGAVEQKTRGTFVQVVAQQQQLRENIGNRSFDCCYKEQSPSTSIYHP